MNVEWKQLKQLVSKSTLAGLLISLGATAFLTADNKIVGALLFSIGLTAVILLEANLYTGKIGYVNSKAKLISAVLILIQNLLVALVCGLIFYSTKNNICENLWLNKLTKSWYEFLFDSIGCGICIYLSVELYKKTGSIFVIVLGVLVFILSGFEHCIANIFYLSASMSFDLKSILYILIAIIGNSIGSLLIRFLQLNFRFCEVKHENETE